MEGNDNYLHEGAAGLDGRSINGGEEDEKPKRQKATIIDGRVIYEVHSYDLRGESFPHLFQSMFAMLTTMSRGFNALCLF